jgi:hypothetical protein
MKKKEKKKQGLLCTVGERHHISYPNVCKKGNIDRR